MTENYSEGSSPDGGQDPMRFWIEQIAETMGASGVERTPDSPPPQDSMEHNLYNALMKEVVYGAPHSAYFAIEPGGRTRFTDPAGGISLRPGEVPPSIAADRMLREGINHISMEGRRLHIQHITHNFSSGQSLEHFGVNLGRIARGLARRGGVLYIDPPLEGLPGEAKLKGLPVDINDVMQQMLNTVATRVLYGFLTDAHTVGRIDDEIEEILPVLSECMGPSMWYLAEQIRGTGVEVRLLGMDRSKESSQLLRDIRTERSEIAEGEDRNSVESRVKDVRLALSLRNYTEWHLLGEMGADLAQRAQRHRVREVAILTTDHYANLAPKLNERSVRVDTLGAPAVSRLQACGQRGYVDPADFLAIFRQE